MYTSRSRLNQENSLTDDFLGNIASYSTPTGKFDLHDEQNYIMISNRLNSVSILENLLKRGFQPHLFNNILFIVASSKGRLNLVERLLQDNRVNPADLRAEAARQAYIAKQPQVLVRLLQVPIVKSQIEPDRMIVYVKFLETVVRNGRMGMRESGNMVRPGRNMVRPGGNVLRPAGNMGRQISYPRPSTEPPSRRPSRLVPRWSSPRFSPVPV